MNHDACIAERERERLCVRARACCCNADTDQSFWLRYRWKEEHNLCLGYTIYRSLAHTVLPLRRHCYRLLLYLSGFQLHQCFIEFSVTSYYKMYWMFYVNDEPKGNFSTQRQCSCIVLYFLTPRPPERSQESKTKLIKSQTKVLPSVCDKLYAMFKEDCQKESGRPKSKGQNSRQ